jgi:hypothetical protein
MSLHTYQIQQLYRECHCQIREKKKITKIIHAYLGYYVTPSN